MYSNEDQSTQSTATWLRRASWDKETESSSTLPEPTRPAAMAEAKDYSDLEVVSVIPASYDGARDKMAVIVDTSEKSPAGTQQTDGVNTGVSMLSPSLADPVPAYPASIRSSTGLTGAAMTKGGDYAEWEQRNAQSVRAGQKRFFGMNSRSLSFLAIAAIAFILILLATVLGITLTMKLNAHNSASSAQSASASGGSGANKMGILSSSRLGAMNWTDTLGTSRTAVFYQDSYNAIMVSIMDSVSNEWTQSNVTQSVMNSTGASKVDVMTGTPFAAVTNRYQISLYYFTSANDVAEAYSSDIVSGTWQAGSLESSLSTQALLGSSLTAYWQVCTNCTGSLCVSYQDTTGRVQLANLTNNAWQFSGPVNPSGVTVVNGTGLSLQPFTEANVTSAVGTDPQGLKMFAFEEAGLLDFEIGLATNHTWKEKVASKLQTGPSWFVFTMNKADPLPPSRHCVSEHAGRGPEPRAGRHHLRRARPDQLPRQLPDADGRHHVLRLQRHQVDDGAAEPQGRRLGHGQLQRRRDGAEHAGLRAHQRKHLRVRGGQHESPELEQVDDGLHFCMTAGRSSGRTTAKIDEKRTKKRNPRTVLLAELSD